MLSPDGHTIHLHLVDGGRGDTDGVANGQIADPVITGLPRPTAAFAGQFSSFRLTTDSHHGTVEWSVVAEAAGGAGPLLSGLSFMCDASDPEHASVRVEGTPAGGAGLVTIRATDLDGSDTRLLFFYGSRDALEWTDQRHDDRYDDCSH